MASRTIYTGIFRAGFPHLSEPHAANANDDPKFSIQAMFPKTGICPINNKPVCSWESIFAALDEVCQEQWQGSFEQVTAPGMGIQFPPRFQDGDTKFQKDAQGRPMAGQVRPETAGMWLISFKNADPVGVAAPTGEDIEPKAVYAGCWGRAQVEVSAYDGKQGRVVAIKLLNFQLCYDDESLGGRAPQQSAGQAFGSMAVDDSNVTAGTHAPAIPPAAGGTSSAPAAKKLVAVPGAQYTIEACQQSGWTEQQMIDNGIAKYEEAPAAAPAPAAAATGTVRMKADSPYTYEQLVAAKYTDQQMIDSGYAEPDFTR